MPDPRPLTGLYGKVPAHGDFVRRGLPTSFVGPWDDWLQQGMAAARERLGGRWAAVWDAAPAWRFALPAGACGPEAVAGVMLPSEDMVGRRFPITLAAILPDGAGLPEDAWFAALEHAAHAGRAGRADADALAASIPAPGDPIVAMDPLPAWPQEDAGVMLQTGLSAPADGDGDLLAFLAGDGAVEAAAPTPPDAAGAPAEPADVLALFGCGAGAIEPVARRDEPGTDILTLLGAAESPGAAPPPAPEGDGTLAFLLGEGGDGAMAPGPPPPMAADGAADPLSLLIGAGNASGSGTPDGRAAPGISPVPDDAGPSPPMATDGAADPLSLLIGAGNASGSGTPGGPAAPGISPVPDDAGLSPPMAADGAADPLSLLIGAGNASGSGTPGGPAAPGISPVPDDAGPSLLAATDSAADPLSLLIVAGGASQGGTPDEPDIPPISADPGPPPAAEPPVILLPAEPPRAPPGGGWWTGGAAHRPPMAWPLPALPAAAEFASLLESDA